MTFANCNGSSDVEWRIFICVLKVRASKKSDSIDKHGTEIKLVRELLQTVKLINISI